MTSLSELDTEDVERYLEEMLPDHARVGFKESNEADFSYGPDGRGRFRVNAYRQRGAVAIALRERVAFLTPSILIGRSCVATDCSMAP